MMDLYMVTKKWNWLDTVKTKDSHFHLTNTELNVILNCTLWTAKHNRLIDSFVIYSETKFFFCYSFNL